MPIAGNLQIMKAVSVIAQIAHAYLSGFTRTFIACNRHFTVPRPVSEILDYPALFDLSQSRAS
jgi:hypothetical protein